MLKVGLLVVVVLLGYSPPYNDSESKLSFKFWFYHLQDMTSKCTLCLGFGGHPCNPRYSGRRDQEVLGLKPASANN
jgi:hypothetical protein